VGLERERNFHGATCRDHQRERHDAGDGELDIADVRIDPRDGQTAATGVRYLQVDALLESGRQRRNSRRFRAQMAIPGCGTVH